MKLARFRGSCVWRYSKLTALASAGTVHYLTLEQIKNAIRELGYEPRQRNVFYEYVSVPV